MSTVLLIEFVIGEEFAMKSIVTGKVRVDDHEGLQCWGSVYYTKGRRSLHAPTREDPEFPTSLAKHGLNGKSIPRLRNHDSASPGLSLVRAPHI